MVEYVLSGSPTRKELDARLRGKGGPPPPFIQNVSFTYVNSSTTLWCCKSVGHEKGLHLQKYPFLVTCHFVHKKVWKLFEKNNVAVGL